MSDDRKGLTVPRWLAVGALALGLAKANLNRSQFPIPAPAGGSAAAAVAPAKAPGLDAEQDKVLRPAEALL